MFNKGLHNKTEFKAVPCNIVEKIIEARDKILSDCEDYTTEDYKDNYEEYFEDPNASDYSLGECFGFLANYSYGCEENLVDIDVQIYTCERYLSKKGKYQGVCELPNGAEVIVFNISAEETGYNMIQVVYFDGNILRTFTPFEGNCVDVLTMTCIGDEEYTKIDDFDESLYKKVVGDEVISKDSYDFREVMCEKYLKWQGCDEDSRLDFDYDAIDAEIESCLC